MREGDYIFHLGVGVEAVVGGHLTLSTLFRGTFEVGWGNQVSPHEGRNLSGGLVLFKCKVLACNPEGRVLALCTARHHSWWAGIPENQQLEKDGSQLLPAEITAHPHGALTDSQAWLQVLCTDLI